MRLLQQLQSRVSGSSQQLFGKQQADRPDEKMLSRMLQWPISPLHYVILHSTRPCLSFQRICGSPKLEPDQNYGPVSTHLRQS